VPRDTPGQADFALPTPSLRRAPAPKFRLAELREEEHETQIACTAMLWKVLLPDVAWTAIDHGHSMNMKIGRHGVPIGILEAQKRKKRGVKAGIADYLFWHRSFGFAIELKTVDGVLSEGQEVFLGDLIRAEIPVSICWRIEQVLERCTAWGLCRHARVMA
jgi:hypothetical protein